MITKIAKDFDWEMSHRLPFHDGLCKNIHGHSYKTRVELEGEPDESNMVVDYYNMKQIIAPLLEELDHSFACESHDELMINFLKENNFKYKIFDFHTTAENLAVYLLKELIPKFIVYPNIHAITIRVYETADVFAEVSERIR